MKKAIMILLIGITVVLTGCSRYDPYWMFSDPKFKTEVGGKEVFERVKKEIQEYRPEQKLDMERVKAEITGEYHKKWFWTMTGKSFATGLIGGSYGQALNIAGDIVISKTGDTELDKILFVAKDYDNPSVKTTDCRFEPVFILAKDEFKEGMKELKIIIKYRMKKYDIGWVEKGNFPNKIVNYVLDWKKGKIGFLGIGNQVPYVKMVTEVYIRGELAGRYVMAGAMTSTNPLTGLKMTFSSKSPHKRFANYIKSHCTQEQAKK